ncbi:MAG: type II toxin-antitoxin system HicB family antitoxin, partial [Candidatus Micrarchaeota archaeon]|nr:type II toxin-antitoxin system HicB family antitoxin [Candidatus Micrarchaeota archaeon]
VVELPGCHTQAKTLSELFKRTGEAAAAYIGSDSDEEALMAEATLRLNQLKSKKVRGFTEKDYKRFVQRRRAHLYGTRKSNAKNR